MDNMHKQASAILQKAFAPPETAEAETQPTDQETDQTSETLETTQETEQAQIDEPGIETLNNLAETLDIDISDMYALNLNIENDDPVTLGALKDHWQQTRDIDKARQELENERSLLQTEREKLKETPPIPPELVQAQARAVAIQDEWNTLEASGLKHTSAGEYSAKAIELQNRWNQVQNELNGLGEVLEGKRIEKMQAQQAHLYEKVPDLKDDEKRTKITNQVQNYIQRYGFQPEDIAAIEDYRLMWMVVEAAELMAQKGSFKDKRIDVAPKVLKPQAVQRSQAGKAAALKRLTEKARQSGQRKDQVAAVSALIKGN